MGKRMDRAARVGLIAFTGAWLLVSAYTTVSLCLSLQNAYASVCIGVLWTISKVVIFEHFRRIWMNQNVGLGGLLVGALSVALIVGDMAGTVSYFMTNDVVQETAAKTANTRYRVYEDRLKSIQSDIEATTKRADDFSSLGRSASSSVKSARLANRSSSESAKLTKLYREQDEALAYLGSHKPAATSSSAVLSEMGLEQKRTLLFLIIAIVVEACPAVGVSMLYKKSGRKSVRTTNDDDYSGSSTSDKNVVSISGYKSSGRDLSDAVRRAEDLIKSGTTPSYTALRRNLSIGQDAVVQVVQQLREQGIIKKEGRGHVAA